MSLVNHCPAGRGEILAALITGISFRRSQALPIGGRLHTTRFDRYQLIVDVARAGFREQILQDLLRSFVIALTKLAMAYTAICIDEVRGRPVLVLESAPYRMLAVDGYWIFDSHRFSSTAYVADVLLEAELRTV